MSKRVEWIDMAKGIGIILVILGHISFRPQWLNIWICSFHMPLFFLLSGITYNSDKYTEFFPFLKTKIKQLVIPYLIFAVVTWVWKVIQQCINTVLGSGFNWRYLVKQFIGILLQIRESDFGIGVWFIPCIFVSFIIMFWIIKISKGNNILTFTLASICFIAGYLYCSYIDVKLPWGVDASFVAVFFMIIGYLIKKNGIIEHMQKVNRIIYLIIWGGTTILNIFFSVINYSIMDRTVGMWSNNYGNMLLFLLESLTGIIAIICILQFFKWEYIQEVGKNSIFYYGVHIIILQMFSYITGYIPYLQNTIVAFVVSVFIMCVTIIILHKMVKVYELIYSRTTKLCSFL